MREICISATFTAEPVRDTLQFWVDELRGEYQIQFAPYAQVFQQLLDPSGMLARNQDGANVVLVRPEDWVRDRPQSGGSERTLEEATEQFVAALGSAAESFRAPLLVSVCPASPAILADPMWAGQVGRAEERLRRYLAGARPITTLCMEELARVYPPGEIHDPHGDELGHVPYTLEFFTALGTLMIRKIYALRSEPYKVVALDCDETLWRGICGEDGPEGVSLDAAAGALQQFMAAQRQQGMLLAITSRNNEEDVLETFHRHPEFPLQLEQFAARKINWHAKSANLTEIASDLNLALDSFIFVDDNPEECAEVQAGRPEVLVVPIRPADDVGAFLRHLWAFDRLSVTEDYRQRTVFYREHERRSELQQRASTLAEFIASLKLEVRISPASPEQLARVSQLTLRTNQMNFTTIRRTVPELGELFAGGVDCRVVDVWDRFGSYGLTGAVILDVRGEALWVDTFLLSCRVLGRGVEHRLLSALGDIAAQRQLRVIDFPFSPTPRNQPARDFLESLGAEVRQEPDGTSVYRLTASAAKAVAYRPDDAPATARITAPSTTTRRDPVPYVRIASELRTVGQILSRIRSRAGAPAAPAGPEAAGTVLEQQVAALWAELLGVPGVGKDENFFSLGGHSLLAVQLLSRARKMFGVDLSLQIVYDPDFTAAEMAKVIELEQMQQLGEGEYAALVDEIGQMTDEEVRLLLAETDQPR